MEVTTLAHCLLGKLLLLFLRQELVCVREKVRIVESKVQGQFRDHFGSNTSVHTSVQHQPSAESSIRISELIHTCQCCNPDSLREWQMKALSESVQKTFASDAHIIQFCHIWPSSAMSLTVIAPHVLQQRYVTNRLNGDQPGNLQ